MVDNVKQYIVDTHSRLVKEPFNDYVKSITNTESSEENRLLDAIYTLEHFIENAKKCAAEWREVLKNDMADNGVLSYKSEHAVASFSKPVQSCIVTNQEELFKNRPDLFNQPTPNKTEIAKLLRKGETIPGVVLNNGGAPTLRIKANV